jgi:hypothetical protein
MVAIAEKFNLLIKLMLLNVFEWFSLEKLLILRIDKLPHSQSLQGLKSNLIIQEKSWHKCIVTRPIFYS